MTNNGQIEVAEKLLRGEVIHLLCTVVEYFQGLLLIFFKYISIVVLPGISFGAPPVSFLDDSPLNSY